MKTKERIKMVLGGAAVGLIGFGMVSAGNGWGLLVMAGGGGLVIAAFEKSKPSYEYDGSTTIHRFRKKR